MRNADERNRITWRVGALGVLAGVGLSIVAGITVIRVSDHAPARRIDDVTVEQPAPVVVDAPVVQITPPSTEPAPVAPSTIPHVDRTAPLDQRVDNLDERVTNLEDTTTTTTTTIVTPTTTH